MSSVKDLTIYELIKSDLYRHTGAHSRFLIIKNLFNSNRSFKYTFWLRLRNHKSTAIRLIARVMHHHLSIKYQIQIPKEVKIGPGLHLGHATCIIINSTAIIGSNCNIAHFVTIGANNGKAAQIGDDCYIGPNSCLVENISIGNACTIGAGTVVVDDIPCNATAVGNPARSFPSKSPGRFIRNRFKISCLHE